MSTPIYNFPPMSKMRRAPERGIVLVMTVLVLSILFVLAYAVSYSAGINLAMARNVRGMMEEDAAAESALDYALALLEKDGGDSAHDSLDEKWAEPAKILVDEMEFEVRIQDQDRCLNVNKATQPPHDPEEDVDLRNVLERVVMAAGGQKTDSDKLIRACDTMRPLVFSEELKEIEGLDSKLFDLDDNKPALDALLSTHPFRINVNTALPAVLDALWPNPQIGRELARRRDERPFKDDGELQQFVLSQPDDKYGQRLSKVLSVNSDFFTVSVTPLTGRGERLTALVRRGGAAANVLLVRRLRLEN